MRAFVTDGNQRAALAITRSLGRRGIPVLVGEQQPASLASSSRYCVGQVTYPSPDRDPEAFAAFLADFVRREDVGVVVPVTDVTTSSVCRSREALRPYTAVAAPTFDAFEAVTDKSRALQAAAVAGIPIPRMHLVEGRSGLAEIIDEVEFPAVVKSIRSRIPTREGWMATGVHYASGPADLRRLYEQTEYLASYPSLIQQRIVGPGLGLFALFESGRLLTTFAHRRLREKPPSGGVSVLCESIPVPPELREDARRLLGPLGWQGVAMLEYKRELRSGRRFLLEVNGRFWGSLQLAVDAGVDFPYLAYQLALGQPPDCPETYRLGVRNRWLLGDVDHLRLRLFNTRAALGLTDEAPSRWRTLVDFLKSTAAGVPDQVLRGDDPGPFGRELRDYTGNVWASLARRARRQVRGACARGLRLARPTISS